MSLNFNALFRSSRPVICNKGVLRNFAKFTGKHQCQSLYFNKVVNFIKIDTLAQVFTSGFCGISKNTCLVEHVWTTASVYFLIEMNKLNIFRDIFRFVSKFCTLYLDLSSSALPLAHCSPI